MDWFELRKGFTVPRQTEDKRDRLSMTIFFHLRSECATPQLVIMSHFFVSQRPVVV